jgi:hypothetical protein
VNLIAHSFDLPSGRSTKSWDATLAIEARLLAAGGHAATRSTKTRRLDDDRRWCAPQSRGASGALTTT